MQLARLIHPVYRRGVQIRSREASPQSLAPALTPATGAETGATSLQPCSRACEQPLFVKRGADVLYSGTLSLWVTYLQRRGEKKMQVLLESELNPVLKYNGAGPAV